MSFSRITTPTPIFRAALPTTGLILAISLVLTIWGVIEHSLWKSIPWSAGGRNRFLLFSLSYWTLAWMILKWKPNRLVSAIAVIALLWALSSAGFSEVIAPLLFLATAHALGRSILFPKTVEGDDYLSEIISLAVGIAALIGITGFLAPFPVNHPLTYLLLIGGVLAIRGRHTLQITQRFINQAHSIKGNSLTALLGYLFLAYMGFVLLPETGHDALAMHLFVPAQVANKLYWDFDVTRHIWAVMPLGADWAYTVAYLIGGEFAARLLNFSFLLVSTSILYLLGLRESDSKSAASLIAILYLSTPLALLETNSLFIENALALMVVSVFAALINYRKFPNSCWIMAFAICLAGAMAIKLHAVLLILIFGLWFCFLLRKYPCQERLGRRNWFILLFFAGVAVWPYALAYLKTGNPVFPFFNAVFASPFFDSSANFTNTRYNQSLQWSLLWDVTFLSSRFLEATPGAVGFAIFTFLPASIWVALIYKHDILLWALTIAVVYCLLIFVNQAYLRYIYPVLFLFFLPNAGLIALMLSAGGKLQLLMKIVLTVVIALNIIFLPAAGYVRAFDIHATLTADQLSWFSHHVPLRRVVEFFNARYGADVYPVFFTSPLLAGLRADYETNSWHNYPFAVKVNTAGSEGEIAELIRSSKFTHMVIDQSTLPSIASVVRAIGRLEAMFNGVYIYAVKYDLTKEKNWIVNGDFSAGINGWQINGNPGYDASARTVQVNLTNTLIQQVLLDKPVPLELTVEAACQDEDAFLRLQVNWYDANNNFLSSALEPRACAPMSRKYTLLTQPPIRAAYALVYVCGHTEKWVTVHSVKLGAMTE